jgi:hypothetical protein
MRWIWLWLRHPVSPEHFHIASRSFALNFVFRRVRKRLHIPLDRSALKRIGSPAIVLNPRLDRDQVRALFCERNYKLSEALPHEAIFFG